MAQLFPIWQSLHLASPCQLHSLQFAPVVYEDFVFVSLLVILFSLICVLLLQIFHMCDEDGRRIPYMCGNNTSFNQKFRVCDWNYNVDCPNSPDWSDTFSINLPHHSYFHCHPVIYCVSTNDAGITWTTWPTGQTHHLPKRRGGGEAGTWVNRTLSWMRTISGNSSCTHLSCPPSFELNLLWDQLRQSQIPLSQQKSARCKKLKFSPNFLFSWL